MAETVTARAANQHFSRLLREVAAGKSFVITHRGRSVARLVPETPPDGPRPTPEQEQALAESIAWARSLKPPVEPTGLFAGRLVARPRRTLWRDAARATRRRPMSRQPPLVTFDSNVLVHAAQAGDPRQAAALELLRLAAGGSCVLTLQALREFFFVVTRKGRATRPAAVAQVRRWTTVFPSPLAATAAASGTAMDASVAGRFSYRDALLLATAAEAGCAAAISEDMAGGAALGSIRVVPAFAGGGVSAAARALL